MPAVVIGAALATAGTAVAGIIAGTAITAAALASTFAVSLVLGGLSYALSPKPKGGAPISSSVRRISPSTFSVRQPTEPRRYIYGQTRIGGIYAHMAKVGGDNGKMHMILILCEGPVQSIDEIWVNDECIPSDWLDAQGTVLFGRYKDKMRIRKHLGSTTQVADALAVSQISEWTDDHRLQGIAYLYITLTKDQDVYPTGVPNFSAVVKGRLIHDPRDAVERWTPNAVLFAYDYLSRSEHGFGATEDDMNADNIAAEANIADEIVDVDAVDMVVDSIVTATDIITLDGDRLLFETGDRLEVVTAGTPPGGLAVDTDYYAIPYQFKGIPRIKLATSLANALAEVAIDITSAGSGTITLRKTGEPRYHGAGIVNTSDSLEDNLQGMLNAIAGRAVNSGGAWQVLSGAWREPTVTLGIGDTRGQLKFRSQVPMAERFNMVRGVYVSAVNDYQPADFPTIRYQTFIDQDNGVEYPRDINLPYTNRPGTAQRIAKIELYRARQEIVFTAPFTMAAIQAAAGDVLSLNLDATGWEDKAFEVTNFTFVVKDRTLLAQLTLRETAEEIYDWTSGEQIAVDPAPNTTLPSPFDVASPTGVAFSSRSVETVDGDTLFTLVLNWDEHSDAFVRSYGDMEIQSKLSSEGEEGWRPSFFVDGALTFTDVLTSSVNVAYDLRIRARNSLGVRSGWVTLEGAIVGSSGGVGTTIDWGSAADSVSATIDWGSAADSVSTFEDWGSVV
jgi:hypothetical protein